MSATVWIEERDAMALHDLIIARYGGEQGLRDAGLLRATLSPHPSSPHTKLRQSFAWREGQGVARNSVLLPPPCGEGWGGGLEHESSLLDMAAAYITGIVRNHPFVDGNKRTGFVVGTLFLELNGFRFTASEEDAAQAILNLAAGTLDEAGLIAFLRENVIRDSEIG